MQNTLRSIIEVPDVGITLSDDTRLSARLWRPVDAEEHPVPLILEYLPYRKRDGTCARDALTHPYFAKRGYACLRVDIRGNGDSDGIMTDEYTAQELEDAVEVINWAAAQSWCTGNVGMMGISWGGFNSLQVAAMQPDPLKAIITLCSTVDRYADDIHYKGGCLLNENLGWGATMWSYSSRAPDPALRPDWREMWLDRLKHEPFLPITWLKHQTRDAYWKHGSVCEDYSAITAKVLAIGGWGDAYKNAVPQIVDNIPGSKGIVGPWVHKYPHFAVPEPRIGFLQEALRWWDRWLKGIETGVEDDPDIRAYLMDGVRPATWYVKRSGHWVGQTKIQTSLPPEEAGKQGEDCKATDLYLDGEGFIQGGHESKSARTDRIVNSPAHCGGDAGEYCAIWLGPELPGDQRADDSLSTCWTSEPLEEDIKILGRINMTLRIADAPAQVQLAARICHVHPGGASTRITYGVANLSHRLSSEIPKQMPPEETAIEIDCDYAGYIIPRGHRLRLSVSNAYWPLVWPSPTATAIRVTFGHLHIPLFNEKADTTPVTFLPPDAEAPWEIETLRPEDHVRETSTDHVSGYVTLRIFEDFGKVRDLEHGLISGATASETWSIHPDDPLSAQGRCRWVDELERGNIRLRTEAECAMWSDATHFYLEATMHAFENDTEVYSKMIEESIPRDHL